MNRIKAPLLPLLAAMAAVLTLAGTASAQIIAYDDAGNYTTNGNWTNGANFGTGFLPWTIATNGPDFHGTYINSLNNPQFVIASVINASGVNYTNVWGIFANGTNAVNETTAFRGFASPLGTNTFKLQWGSRGAGTTTLPGPVTAHGWCGFTLRTGNATNTADDFQTGARLYIYFKDGASPSTIYAWDDTGSFPISLPGTSFSDLGRQDITNALEAEVTVGDDGNHYHLVLKDCVVNKTLATLDSVMAGSGTIDSAALFCQETTGDQVYNRMQITIPRVPPLVLNVQPTNGTIYLDASANTLSFEVDSLHSTVQSSAVAVTLNGVPQTVNYNTASPTTQLTGNWTASLAPNTFYTLQIIAQDANGDATTNVSTFNTFLASNLYIDASDYNYNSGGFIDALAPANAYAPFFGSNGVDYLETDLNGTNNAYRVGDLPQVLNKTQDPIDHANEVLNGHTVYNMGFTDVGEWQNYTRTVPSPTNYSIYARAASAGTGLFEIEELTNTTATTSNQTPVALGRVNVPNSGASTNFAGQLLPLTDIFGATAIFPLSGLKTYRTTAISSRGYNLEYLVFVPVTNAANPLRPYISVASPAPNATAVPTTSKISFTIVNRQTTVSSVQLLTNGVTATPLVTSNFLVGTSNFFSPAGLPASSTNTITVIITDSAAVQTTNTWTFVTAPLAGNGVWSGGGSPNLNWSTAANWTGGVPGPGFTATFGTPGSTASLVTNNIVAANVTIQGLFYNTNSSGYHTTLIPDGVTLTVSNPTPAIATAVQVGNDIVFNKKTTNTITGLGGTLFVIGPVQSGVTNQLNFQVRQCASPASPNQTTLDMSGLGTLIANVGKFYVAQGGNGAGQSNVSGCLFLARTNTISLSRPNAGQFEVGDSSTGAYTLPGSSLYMGITNTIFVDTMRIGKQKATNNIMTFNPSFLGNSPGVFIRGTNGVASRASVWTIGDADTDTVTPINVDATCDFSGGKLDALVKTMVVGEGCTSVSDTGKALGILTFTGGTLDVNNLTNGIQRANNTATEAGIINVTGSAALISANIVLAQAAAGANASLVAGTINVTNGTVRGNLAGGGGLSTVNINGGTLVVSNNAGTVASPISALNLAGAALHLNVDGNATTPVVNATAASASGTTITIDSVNNVTGTTTIHLIGYSGSDPFAGLSLAPLPSGYTGNLVDNAGSVDLSITSTAPPPHPTIGTIKVGSGGQVVLSGTNNDGAGGTYHVLTSTNLTMPGWSVLTNGSFDSNGRFSVTNNAGTNSQRYFRLQVP
jgi:hypothetical protein